MTLTKDDKILSREERIILNGKHQIRNLPEQEDDICEYVEELFLTRYHKVADEIAAILDTIAWSNSIPAKNLYYEQSKLLNSLIQTLRAKD